MMKSFKRIILLTLSTTFILLLSSCGSNPDKSASLLDKGTEYYFHAQYSKALEFFKKAIDEDDSNFEAWFWLGNYYENFGKHNRAIEDYDKAIELNPNYADAFANRAKAKKGSNDKKGACADWRKAAKLGKPNLDDNLKWCTRNGM